MENNTRPESGLADGNSREKKRSEGSAVKKKRRRFNLIDLCVIVAALAVIGAALYVYLPGLIDKTASKSAEYRIVLVFDSVPDELKEAVKDDDVALLADSAELGKDVSVSVSGQPAGYLPDGAGGSSAVYAGGLSRITVTVSAELETVRPGLYCGGIRIAAGNTYQIRFPSFGSDAECVSIVPAE